MRIIILDDDEALRFVLRDYFKLFASIEAYGFGSLAELKEQRAQLPQFHAAILDVNLGPGQPNGLDAHHWLRENGFTGRIVFLTAYTKSHPIVRSAAETLDAVVFEKPMDIELLIGAIIEREAA